MADPLRTIPPTTPDKLLDDVVDAYWQAIALFSVTLTSDDCWSLSKVRAAYLELLERHGRDPGPCPWIVGAPENVGKANPGFGR